MTVTTIKHELHELIDLLPETEAREALDFLRRLSGEDSLSEDEWAEVRLGEAEIARGDVVSFEDLKRDLSR